MIPKAYTLLTGATGQVGRFLLAELLRQHIPVAVLVRARRGVSPADRVESLLASFEAAEDRRFARPVALEGDLTAPVSGLAEADQEWCGRHVGRVLHCAASLSFRPAADHPHGEPYRSNVQGTREVEELCRRAGIREMHYVSSAYVAGLRDGLVLESDGDCGQSFSNDYERSKLQAEDLLRRSDGFDSLTVYRPSIVVENDSQVELPSDRTIWQAYTTYKLLSTQIGMQPPGAWLSRIGLSGLERKNLVSAKWVSEVITGIVGRPELHDATYHLTHPTGTTTADIVQGFHRAMSAKSTAASPAHGAESMDVFASQFLQAFSPYFRDDPKFDTANLDKAIAVCGLRKCPEIGATEILELAKRSEEPTRSKVRGSVESARATDHWPRLAKLPPASPGERLSGGRLIGAVVIGPGGGDWLFSTDADGGLQFHGGGAESACVRLFCDAATWRDLMEGELTLAAGLGAGRLLLETDAGEDVRPWLNEFCRRFAHSFSTMTDRNLTHPISARQRYAAR